MAISINWATKVITVPQSYLTNLGGGVYELDVNQFRLDLKDLEDSEEGMMFPNTHNHNTEVTLSGVTYARTFEIINGYTVSFENGSYTVKCAGANHNIADVKVVNSVSLLIGNSAGLIVAGGGGGDPWLTSLPGGYSGTQAGAIVAKIEDVLDELGDVKGAGFDTLKHNLKKIKEAAQEAADLSA